MNFKTIIKKLEKDRLNYLLNNKLPHYLITNNIINYYTTSGRPHITFLPKQTKLQR